MLKRKHIGDDVLKKVHPHTLRAEGRMTAMLFVHYHSPQQEGTLNDRVTERKKVTESDRSTDRQSGRATGRQSDRATERQSDRSSE